MVSNKKVLIVGGGIGGLEVAKYLAKNGVESIIVTDKDYYISGPSRPLILSNEQQVDRIIRGYNHLEREIKVIFGKVAKIDRNERKLYLSNGRFLEYDYLVVATGVKYDYGAIQIENEKVYNVYDLGKLYDLKHLIWNKNEGKIVVYAPPQPYRCAPAPFETVMTIDMILRHRKIRDKFELIFIDANPKVQPPVIHDIAIKLFEEANIQYYLDSKIVRVTENYVELENGDKIEANIKVILPPNKANNPLGESFIEVRSPNDLRLKEDDNIYAVGDVAKLPYPKNSEIASISARIAASQILEDLGIGAKIEAPYKFIGWAYAGNIEGQLKTKSIKFELEFTSEGPKGNKDPEPKHEYTLAKDRWEQAILKKLFNY